MNAPFLARAGTREPFAAFLCDISSEDVARASAGAFNWPLERVQSGGLRFAIQSLAVSTSPSVLLVDLSECADPMEEINGLAEVCEPGTMVLCCGTINDVRFYRDLVASGIHDYLVKPFTEAQLNDAILGAQAAASGQREREAAVELPHMMAAVVGVRGGVGSSTISVSLAWLLGQAHARKTALLDLDVHFGTGALALDLEPGRGLTDAIENPSRIDGLFIERALVHANDRLAIMSAEAPINQPVLGDGTVFFQLQDELRNAYEGTVIDLPRHMLVQHPGLLQPVGVCVVVTELTLAATRDTIRILSWLRSNAPNTRVVLVANKAMPAGQEEIARKDFEASVERKVDFTLPYEPKVAVQAAKVGKPIAEAAASSRAGQALARLAESVVGIEDDGAKRKSGSLLDKLAALKPSRKPAAKK